MSAKIGYLLQKAHKPLKAIEYIISIGILWAAAVSVLLISSDEVPADSSSFSTLIEQYEIVSMLVFVMGVLAVLDLVALTRSEHPKSIGRRAVATFGFTVGFVFVAMLTVLSSGFDTLLWVNEVTMAFISAVLYLNLKVNPLNADR